jgi:hypothetical protein
VRLNGKFPRNLTDRELDWILWMLPSEKSGYKDYRSLIEKSVVIG